MTIESSLTRNSVTEKKKLHLDCLSPESSLTQVDSDSESTSASSSMQSSVSSVTSSLDQGSSNVNNGTQQKKTLNNSFSKKFATFGSFMSYRRRAQSKLSQTSVKLSDDGSTTPPQSSSIEVSDESSNYVEKPMPKFTRNGSLRSVKILRSKSKNKSTLKLKKSSINKKSEVSGESHSERATFSSILKDSKFPEQLKHQTGPSEPEEVLPIAKLCPYQHCSLHGHHHHHESPQKRFEYLKRRTTKDQQIIKPKSQPMDKSSMKKREVKGAKKISNDDDFSIEFYAKTRSEPFSSHDHDDAEFADILFGVNSFQEKKSEVSISNNHDFNEFNYKKDEISNGSTLVFENKQSLKKTNQISMWHMIHQHMVTGLAAESGELILQEVDEEKKSQTKDFDDSPNQESEIRKMYAIKLVRDAIEKILLPELQDDQSTTSEAIPEQDLSETNQNEGEITSGQKDAAPVTAAEARATKTETGTPNRWSYLKKVILLTKFVKELEKVKKFNPKKPRHLPLAPGAENETVSLRRQTTGDKKSSDEWMLDYALQKVVGELAPTQKRKVALLVKAFETVAPAQDDPQESGMNSQIQSVGSESKSKFQDMQLNCVDSKVGNEIKMTPPVVPSSFSEKNKESKSDLEKEKHIKMWHMIYQHVATDIVTRVGSELLLDGEESTNGEEKNSQEDEDQTERNYRLQFTKSDAFKLVQESVDEILLPDVSDNSSQDTQSVASDIASDQGDEDEPKKIEKDFAFEENKKVSAVTRLQQQKSKNWSKLKKLILLKRSMKALEGFRQLKPQTPEQEILKSDQEEDKVDLSRQMMDERKKAEQWMLDYAVQHIVTKLTPARKKRVSMLVEAFEAVVPFPEILIYNNTIVNIS